MSKISIIVAIYNVEKYLDKCLNSLINQTFQDIEIVCINDGSTDNSHFILDKYAKLDSRITIINQKNSGVACARNTGLKIATSPYIMFVDPDDWLELDACLILYNTITSTDCDAIQFQLIRRYDYNYKMIKEDKFDFHKDIKGVISVSPDNFHDMKATIGGKVFKKEIIDKYQIQCAEGLYYEDANFLLKYVSAADKILFIEDNLYNYFRRSDSITSKTEGRKSLMSLDIIKIMIDYYEYLNKYNLFDQYEKAFWTIFENYFWQSILNLRSKNQHLALELAFSFLKNKDIEHLKDKLNHNTYINLHNIKTKNFREVYTIKTNNLFKKCINFIYRKTYKKNIIKIKILGITILKMKQ